MERNNINHVLYHIIKELKIPVSALSIDKEVAKHPFSYSLLAISQILDNWKIPNQAFQLSLEELLNAEHHDPFIVHLNTNKGEFAVVNHIDNNKVILSNEHWNEYLMKVDEFKAVYNGVILVVEKMSNSGELDYKKNHRREIIGKFRTPLILSCSIILLVLYLLNNTALTNIIGFNLIVLAIIKTAGIVITILLLTHSIDMNNPIIQRLCGSETNKNCNAILSSPAAKITNSLSWSEVGFFYFSGTWLTLLFNSNSYSLISLLAIFNLISLPYTFYSIYFQFKIAKQWCTLCCTIQVFLWLEFIFFTPYLNFSIIFPSALESLSLMTSMFIPILAWAFMKPYFLQSKQFSPLKKELRKFKFNQDVFKNLLENEEKFELINDENTLVVGDRSAENVITFVSNPYCHPCTIAHKSLDSWASDKDGLKIQYIFCVNGEDDFKFETVSHFMELQDEYNESIIKESLNDWYDQWQKTYKTWALKYPILVKPHTKHKIAIQKEWCDKAAVKSTPTFFVNGRRLPAGYKIEDIKYLLS